MANMIFAPDGMKVVEIVPQALLSMPNSNVVSVIRFIRGYRRVLSLAFGGALQDAGLPLLGLGCSFELHVPSHWGQGAACGVSAVEFAMITW